MILARNTGTPLSYYLSCTLDELKLWIQTNNEIQRELQERTSSRIGG